MFSWLDPPPFDDVEVTRKVGLLFRLLRVTAVLALFAALAGSFDPANKPAVTLGFYTAVLAWLGVVGAVARKGHVALAAWGFSLVFWLLIALVTLGFGGLQGANASLFAVCTLLIGSVAGGHAAVWMALASSAWCGLVAYLEQRDLLPWHFGSYTPLNAWTAVTITVLLTTILLHESLSSMRRMHLEAQKAAGERDEALRRSIQGQKMELVGNLTSGIAHDLNNLLTVIIGAVDVLRIETSPEDQTTQVLLDDLENATSRSALLTSQLLGFGRTQASEGEAVDVSAVLDATSKMLPRLLGTTISVVAEGASDCWVFATRTALEQVLLNLAVNARDAMPGGGRLNLAISRADGQVVLRASDTGAGMSAAVQTQIFEPFFTTKAAGTGLGLATVKQLTEHYGGRVEVASEPGRGTTFTVSFPRIAAPETPASERACAVFASELMTATTARHGRVLLVEDDALVRKTLCRALTLDGYDVTALADGEEALAIVGGTDLISCIVTDISMQHLDGDTLATRLSKTHPALPIVIISGNREPAPGVTTGLPRIFLSKPVAQQELREAIHRLLQRAES